MTIVEVGRLYILKAIREAEEKWNHPQWVFSSAGNEFTLGDSNNALGLPISTAFSLVQAGYLSQNLNITQKGYNLISSEERSIQRNLRLLKKEGKSHD